MRIHSYLVGGLRGDATPAEQEAKLNECGALGWELVQAVFREYGGANYIFFFFKTESRQTGDAPRFDVTGIDGIFSNSGDDLR